MFHKNHPKSPPKSPLLKTVTNFTPASPTPEVKTHEAGFINNGNVEGMFKLSNSRVLICEKGEDNSDRPVYILDLNTSAQVEIPCNTPFFPDESEVKEIEFGEIEACLELAPDKLILRLRTNHCPYPLIQHYFVMLDEQRGIPIFIKESPDLEFGRTTVLSPTLLASLRYSNKTGRDSLDFFTVGHRVKLSKSFDLQKRYHSLTAVDSNTLVLGGRNGDVDVCCVKDNELHFVSSLTSLLASKKNSAAIGSENNQLVRMIGKKRDVLLIAGTSTHAKPTGLVSTLRWDAKSNKFNLIACINTHKLTLIRDLMEFEDSEHFALLDKFNEISVLNERLLSFKFPYNVQYQTFIDFPGGCALHLSSGKVKKLELDYRELIKAEVELSTPLHSRFGHLSRYVAEYACIGEVAEVTSEIGKKTNSR